MSNRLGVLATTGIITAGILGIHAAPYAYASPNEDQPGWSCVDDGNRVCGPGNSNGVPPGCYDDGGVLFAPWPCIPWDSADGYRHSDGTITPAGKGHRGHHSSKPKRDRELNHRGILAAGTNAYDDGAYVGGYN